MKTRLSPAFLSLSLLAACGTPPSSSPQDLASLPAHCAYLDASSTQFVACKGAFQAGKAEALCPAGYTTKVSYLPATLKDACTSFRGKTSFYAVDLQAWNDPLAPFNRMSCQANMDWLPGLMGCGGSLNATATPSCMGWPVELICQKTSEWLCQHGGLATASNKDPEGGVICFRATP